MTPEPRRDSSGTTCTASFSRTAQVSERSKGSPTRTAPALVRHQHRIGSTSTEGGPGGTVAGAWEKAGTAPIRPIRVRMMIAATRISLGMRLSQPPFCHEFTQGDVGLGLIESNRHDVDVARLGQTTNLLLPLARSFCQLGVGTARDCPGTARLHVHDFHPPCRDLGKVEGEGAVDQHEEHVVGSVEERQLLHYLLRI